MKTAYPKNINYLRRNKKNGGSLMQPRPETGTLQGIIKKGKNRGHAV